MHVLLNVRSTQIWKLAVAVRRHAAAVLLSAARWQLRKVSLGPMYLFRSISLPKAGEIATLEQAPSVCSISEQGPVRLTIYRGTGFSLEIGHKWIR